MAPFQFDGSDLEYAKDDALDRNMLEDGEWLRFYKGNLGLLPEAITSSLNGYFESIARERDLLGNP